MSIAIAVATYFSLVGAEPFILPFQRFPGTPSSRANYAYASQRTLISLGALIVLVLVGFALVGQPSLGAAVAGWGIGIAATRLVSTCWLMWGKPWQYSLNLAVGTGARTASLLVTVLIGVEPLLAVAAAGAVAAVAAWAVGPRFALFSRHLPHPSLPWTFGMNLALGSLAFTALTNASLLILAGFSAPLPLARFAAMTQFSAMSSSAVIGLMLTVMYPRLRAFWDTGSQEGTNKKLELLKLTCLIIALATIALALVDNNWLLNVAVGKRLVDVAILPSLVLSTAFAGMGQLSSWYHQFAVDAAAIAFRTFVTAMIGVAATVGLAALWGQRGAALATSLGFLLYYTVMNRRTGGSVATTLIAIASFVLGTVPLLKGSAGPDVYFIVALVGFVTLSVLAVGRVRRGIRL